MILIKEIFQMWSKDNINSNENGYTRYESFNNYLKRAEINLLRMLTGGLMVDDKSAPKPFETQKIKDYIQFLITPYKAINSFEVPADYYTYDNMWVNNSKIKDCENNKLEKKCDIIIEILDGDKFNSRCRSFITGVKPTANNPIAKIANNRFVFAPEDVGNVTLEYIRYPKFGKIVTTLDTTYNQVVIDEVLSTNIEWGEWAIDWLIYFMTKKFAVHTRERNLSDANEKSIEIT